MSSTRYELLVKIGDDKYYLDTFKYDVISLNYDIANIRDISGRNSSYSKTIRLPDSEHNREVLGFITNLAVDSTVDANKAIKTWVLVDTIPVFEGNLQLKKFQKNFKTGEFDIEIVIFADNDTLFTTIGEKYISDLDLSAYNHTWTADNIRFSWTQSTGFPYRYPLIDYGSNWNMGQLNGLTFSGATQGSATQSLTVDEMFPAISRKIIFDRIFQEAGFNYDSEFLNSDYFKNEYIPFNGTRLFAVEEEGEFFVNFATQSLAPQFLATTVNLNLQSSTSTDYWNGTNIINNSPFTVPIVLTFYLKITGQLFPLGYPNYSLVVRNTTTNQIVWSKNVFAQGDTSFGSYDSGTQTLIIQFISEPILIEPSNLYRVQLAYRTGYTVTLNSVSYVSGRIDNSSQFIGMPIDVAKSLPRKIKQRDFILSACREYNLYIEPSKEYQNTLVIDPRDDYYDNGRIKDWTSKLDSNQPIEVDILAETQNKITTFSHKEDKDYLNQNYKQSFNEIYGQYDFDSGNEFAKSQNKKIESIFSPTPLNIVPGSFGLVIPLITKDTAFSFNTESKGRLETNIRTLQWGGLVEFNNLIDKISFDGQYITSNGNYAYPYAGHLDNPYEPTVDNNFGDPIDVYFPNNGLTTNNLFNRFWYKTMLELTNKDSRILTANFFLTPEDIYNFRFSDKIYLFIDGNGQYYKVNKISDFDPGTTKSTKVELLRTFDVQVNTFKAKFIGNGKGGIRVPPRVEIDVNKVETGIVDIGNNNTINSDNVLVNGNSNYIESGDNTFVNGDNNVIGELNKNTVVIGDMNKIDPLVKNSIIIGDSNRLGTQSQGVYIFGSNNEIVGPTGSTLSNVFVLGDGLTITQSNTNYIGGDTIFSGTVSFLQSPQIGLQDVIDYNNKVRDTKVDILDGNVISINRDTSIYDISLSLDSISINSPDSFMSDVSGVGYNSMINANLGSFITFSSYSSIMNSMNCFIENGNRASIISGFNNSMESTSFSIFSGNVGSSIIGGVSNKFISDGLPNLFSTIISGSGNEITNTSRSSIIGGQSNKISRSSLSSLISSSLSEMYNATKSLSMMDDSTLIGTSSNVLSIGNSNSLISNSNSIRLFSSDNITISGMTNSTFISVSGLTCSNSILPFSINSLDILMDDTIRSSTFTGKNNIMIDVEDSIILGSIDSSLTYSTNSIIVGGRNNNLSSPGEKQGVSGGNSVIVGGSDNALHTDWESAVIVGGINNEIGPVFGGWSTIVGGDTNKITGFYANISGGVLNIIGGTYGNGNYSFIGGGWGNQIYGTESSSLCRESGIVGGFQNTINTRYAFIGGGAQNRIKSTATQSSILGGQYNTIEEGAYNSVVLGGNNITATESNTAYLPNVKMYGDAFIQGRLDLTKLGIESILRIIPSGATPSSPLTGDVFYRDGVGLYYWNGVKWVVIGKDPVEYNQLSATQSLSVNNTTSALTDITGWTFSFDANSYYQFEGYIDASCTSGSGTNNIGLCVGFNNSVTAYMLTITDVQSLYPSDWSGGQNEIIGISNSSNTINRDARIRATSARFKIQGFVRTSSVTTGQFKWTYRNDGNRTFNILSGSIINIIKM